MTSETKPPPAVTVEDLLPAIAELATIQLELLRRLEHPRVEAVLQGILANMATKADIAEAKGGAAIVGSNVSALEARLGKVEQAIDETVKSALSKAMGPWQFPAVLAACAAIFGVTVAAVGWLIRQPWFWHQ